jgi:hypothetical protein
LSLHTVPFREGEQRMEASGFFSGV